MTRRLRCVVTMVVLAAGAPHLPASAAEGPSPPFAAYGSGAAIILDTLRLHDVQAANVKAAFAGQVVNSLGLDAPTLTESDIAVQPPRRGSQAYARGSGLEAGLLTPVPAVRDPNQVVLAGVAEAVAPPAGGEVVESMGDVDLGDLASTAAFRSRARARFDLSSCGSGGVLASGEGETSSLHLLGPATAGTRAAALPGVSRTASVTHLVSNGDGTYGVVSETRQKIAPVSLLGGLVTVELLGEWVLRAAATGKPGGARIDYAPVGAGPTTTVVRVNGLDVTLQQLLGPSGVVLDLWPIARVRVGAPARAAFGTRPPRVAADGTSAFGAVDAVHVALLELPLLGVTGADVRVGHMEAGVAVPPGGLRCGAG
ncbi:MAG TPA: hypothetical protein VM287_12290 [Egibacteraceae bacterium]|nr:hypothetical protein [Egibacteraceae bacterium]